MRYLIILFALLVISLPLAAQPIYKVVDEHGNVTYTDQKPSDDARPMDLPEINVLGSDTDDVAVVEPDQALDSPGLNFRILSPENEERIITDGDTVGISLGSDIQIPPTAMIVLYVNEIAQAPIQSMDAQIESLDPGEHSFRAELQTSSGRVLAETETITFFKE